MITSTTFWGLKPNNKIIGGATSSITVPKHTEPIFKRFEAEDCIIGCIIQHSECGCLDFEPTYWWWGDTTIKEKFMQMLRDKWKAESD